MNNRTNRKTLADRRGLSGPVIAIIILVVGVALALVAAAMTGGFLFGWGSASKVTIEKADVLVNPGSPGGIGFITVDIRNSGGSSLQTCTIDIFDQNGETVAVTWTSTPTFPLNPGGTASYSADNVANLVSGQLYTVSIRCTDPAGREVVDKKTVLAHI